MPPRLLIVDDSDTLRRAMINRISSFDFDIFEATDGVEGLEIARKQNIDLIVTDVDMPNMDGIRLCEKLKSDAKTRMIPVVIQSSFDREKDIEKGFKAGAHAYLSKDKIDDRLIDTINSIVSKTRLNKTRKILVVDDSDIIRKIVETGLVEKGFQVKTAINGKEALKHIEKELPHLILSDINMPEMNGFDLCQTVISDPKLSGIPFVVMSSNHDKSRMQRMLSLGAQAYLYKPFNVDELVVLIEKLLSDQFLLLLNEKERLVSEQNLTLASISSLITALEARDAYTRGHSEDVAQIAARMAFQKGLGKKEIDRLILGARLHDIGKIGIKDSVLLKPGNLSDEEYAQIKKHPIIGATILEPIESLSDIIDIVLYHHERFDGKGYPQQKKGDAIPLWARMVAVADTYNALTSDRPYRQGMPTPKAIEIIQDVKGTQLCPDCVDLFLNGMSTV